MKAPTLMACLWGYAMAGLGSAWAQQPDPLVDQGRALYFGTQKFANPAQIAGASLPAGASACVNCHGALGAGVREGVQAAPDIRLRAAPEANKWLVAAMHGKTLNSRALNTSMPRYQLTQDEQAALAAYAPLLGSAADTVRGVTTSEIVLGVYMPDNKHPQTSKDILAGVTKVFAAANLQGGVHGRKLRAVPVRSPEQAQSVFALVGSLHQDNAFEHTLAALRLPSLAALTLSHEAVKTSGWTAPLLPSLQEQTRLMVHTLNAKAAELDCTPWLVDTLQGMNADDSALGAVQRFTSVDAASVVARPARLCLGLVTGEASSAKVLTALTDGDKPLPLVISLAVLGTVYPRSTLTLHLQILPTPPAVASHANAAGQTLWTSLGEAAGHAVVEALARSGNRLQPEIALAKLRELSGYAPLKDAPVAWSRTHAHGWQPTVWAVPHEHVGLHQSP
jgi:mono/diheme cytochrome c family protein